jgi:hypothetical protein
VTEVDARFQQLLHGDVHHWVLPPLRSFPPLSSPCAAPGLVAPLLKQQSRFEPGTPLAQSDSVCNGFAEIGSGGGREKSRLPRNKSPVRHL